MSSSLQLVLTYISFPVVATILGGIVAAIRPPGPQLKSAIQHFAAGVVFAAVATELLPRIRTEHNTLAVVIGFGLGVALMLGVKWLLQRFVPGAEEPDAPPTGMIITVGIDMLIDGVLIGIGFTADAEVGVLLTLALTLELLFLGLSVSAALHQAGKSRARSIATTAGLASLVLIGAVVGTSALAGLSGAALVGMLAFGVAALLYLVTEELLVEAHEEPETLLSTAMFFVGFLVLLVLA
ncbi:MAG: transporter [Deltaproteobacteria bacterium]|nr:transporter [Deltaproteobacteria bacterium]